MSNTAKQYFTRQLITWHQTENSRDLPWKSEKDPYKIWLSEVILQQTRALQGLPYYERFTSAYPTIADMAAADDTEVFRIWQGLGYYNRCKNMLATARHITTALGGKFPDTYEGLISLKGIGAYTAAAIGSFAYGLPHAVVDGNVYRVLSRYFAIRDPYDTTEGKKVFYALAQSLLDTGDSAAYNQAIMDLGATVCTPRNPQCPQCPLQLMCEAYRQGLTEVLPVKSKKLQVRTRYFNYLLLRAGDTLWVHKRTDSDIWQNLYEPYLLETSCAINADDLIKHADYQQLGLQFPPQLAGSFKQRLTHQLIHTSFFIIDTDNAFFTGHEQGIWLDAAGLKKTPFPKTVLSFLENNLYF